jgi:hypothetical protein
MALAESDRQARYLRTFFRLLFSWVHRSMRWSKNQYAEDRLMYVRVPQEAITGPQVPQ